MLANHLRFLAPLAVGLLALVLLLSSIEIRRILVPLETLLARIKAVAGGQETQAEFGGETSSPRLPQTFGDMERRIGRQVETLQTLADIDRLILERVPAAEVIDVVIARIEQIVDVLATGVILQQASGERRGFVRVAGQNTVEAAEPVAPETPREAAHDAQTDRRWRAIHYTGLGFDGLGVRRTWLLRLGHRDQVRSWIALGCASDRAPARSSLRKCAKWPNASRWR